MSLSRPLEAVIAAARAADALLQERLLAIESAAWLSEETADDKVRLTAAAYERVRRRVVEVGASDRMAELK